MDVPTRSTSRSPATETHAPSFAAAASSMTGESGGTPFAEEAPRTLLTTARSGGRTGTRGVARRSVARREIASEEDATPATVSGPSWKARWYRYTRPPSATTASVFLPSRHFAARNAPSSATVAGDRQKPPRRRLPRQISSEEDVTKAVVSARASRSRATTGASPRTAGLASAVGCPTANIAPTDVRRAPPNPARLAETGEKPSRQLAKKAY